MNILAYCTQPAAEAVERVTGTIPVTSPPTTAASLPPDFFSGYDLIYLRLHGDAKIDGLAMGEDMRGNRYDALHVGQVADSDAGESVVVIANCYGSASSLPGAFYEAGASAVIAGDGPNYGGLKGDAVGADLLVRWVVLALKLGLGVQHALMMAKARLKLQSGRAVKLMGRDVYPNRDALEFKIKPKEV